jgi:formylglycine-generating enzyme required for sulfatase activity
MSGPRSVIANPTRMATYGIYQVLDPLYVTPTGSVRSAKIVGGEDEGRIAAKVFNPPVSDDPDEPNWEPKYFLDRAQVQRRVAAAGGAHWAPVYASGFTPDGGAYYVTDYHALTAQKMIEGRVPVEAAALHAIASSVVAGLEEIQRVAGRSHANLKPTNVLLLGKGKPGELRALLCDPGQDYKAEKDGEAGDLHALGRLIHELVTHRPAAAAGTDAAAAPTVAAGPEWARLGGKAEAWRQLCADLLSQPLPPRAASLAAVAKTIAGLAPPRAKASPFRLPGMRKRAEAPAAAKKPPGKPRGPRRAGPSRARVRRLVVQGLAVVLLVGGGLFVVSAMEANAREELCDAREAWLGPLVAGLSEPQRREWFERDPHLRQVVEGVDQVQRAGVECAGGRVRPLGFLQYTRTRDAVATLRQVERDLAPENWPRLQRLRELAVTLERRGWQQPAGYVAQLVEGVRPTPVAPTALSRPSAPAAAEVAGPPNGTKAKVAADDGDGGSPTGGGAGTVAGGSLASRIERVLRVQPVIEEQAPEAAAQWARLEAAAGELERVEDPVVRAFGGLLRAQGLAAVRLTDEGFKGLPTLDQHAALAGQVLASLAGDAKRPVNVEKFNAEVVRSIDLDELELAHVRLWLEKRPAYAVQTEDRAREAALLKDRFAAVRTKVEDSAPDAPVQEAFANATRDVEVSLGEFERAPFVAADVVEGGAFGRRVAEIAAQIDDLNRYYHSEDAADWLKNLGGVQTTSDRIKRHWAAWLARLRDDGRSMSEKPKLFARNKKLTDDLRYVLTEIDLLPPVPDKLTPAFKAAAAQRREERIGELLAKLDPAAPASDPQVLTDTGNALAAWYDELLALNGTFPIPATRVLTLDDRPDVAWQQRNPALWADPLVRKVVAPDLDRIERLQRLRAASRDELVRNATAADAPRSEVVVAAWKLLGESPTVKPAWPNTVEELKLEQALRDRVRAAIQPLGDFEREQLQESLDNEGPRRWRRFVEAIAPDASAEEKLAAANASWRAFNVNNTAMAELDPPARFNFWLFIAKENARIGNPDQTAVIGNINSLMEAAAELKGDPQQRRGAAIREKLSKLEGPEPFGGRNLKDEFPLQVRGLAQPILFRRVEPEGVRPFYIGAREVTLGQFVGALHGQGKWAEALRLGWPQAPGKPDGRRGPRVWEWDAPAAPTLMPAELWMTDVRDGRHNNFPNEFRQQRFNRNVLADAFGGMPSERHPMQYVTPQAALYFAASLGCRLPTSAEWRAALEASGQPADDGRGNLRDQASWETFARYAERERIAANHWPDGGAFPGEPRKPTDAPPAARPGNDSTLLFRAAPQSEGDAAFHDLVGNVAEYVCDRPEALAAWDDGATPDGIKRFLNDTPDAIAVIGGSALSPPDVPLAEPLPLKRTDLAYSDVGLRLAFTAPARNLAERLKWALAGEEYLPPIRTVSASTGNDAR